MDRFPEDFMFQLTEAEFAGLRSQLVTSKKGRGGRRYLPYVFTEQDVAMLSGVLSALRVPLFPTTDRPGGMVQLYAMAGVSFYITDVSIQLDGMGGTSNQMSWPWPYPANSPGKVFGPSLAAGLAWQPTKSFAIFGEYRYTSFDVDFDTTNSLLFPPANGKVDTTIRFDRILFGIRI